MRKENFEPIPNQLRRYRRTRALRQKDVAVILDLKSTSMISRWEQGRCLPSSLNIFRLAVIYRTMVDALFFEFKCRLGNEISKREQRAMKNKTAAYAK
jgi:transcriptional regulator with XRE-family HTH domain